MAIRRHERLRHKKDFDAVFRRGRSWNNKLLVLRTLPNDLANNRYGFVTSKRVGKAVVRNRVRRRLREIVRDSSLRQGGWDVVISAKSTTADATFRELKHALADLFRKSSLLDDTSSETNA